MTMGPPGRHGRPRARAAIHGVGVVVLALAIAGLASGGCSAAKPTPAPTARWSVGPAEPAFDPEGPPDPVRWALERLLTRGLVAADSSGRIVLDVARAIEVSNDSLVYTFHIDSTLAFTDGARCSSAHFAKALAAGLDRRDHATRLWLLAAVRGADRVRAGRPLPPLGIETSDAATIVLRLARRDPDLLRKLALPGVSHAWADRAAPSWTQAVGLGPYRVIEPEVPRRLALVRAAPAGGAPPDTIRVRFSLSSRHVRALLRAGATDLVWPIPPDLPDEPIQAGYRLATRPADPPRRLLLVARADLPPTSRFAARAVLTHGIRRERLLERLGRQGRDLVTWFDEGTRFAYPIYDREEALRWMDRGKLGRSFHVDLGYDGNSVGALVARPLQLGWAEQSLYVEGVRTSGGRFAKEALNGRAHLLLVESQALLADPAAELAALVMPLRGPAVGAFRTGWRTREFDPWIAPTRPPPPFPAATVRARLEEDRIVLPVAALPWAWVEREGATAVAFDPHYGPRPDPQAGRVSEPAKRR